MINNLYIAFSIGFLLCYYNLIMMMSNHHYDSEISKKEKIEKEIDLSDDNADMYVNHQK